MLSQTVRGMTAIGFDRSKLCRVAVRVLVVESLLRQATSYVVVVLRSVVVCLYKHHLEDRDKSDVDAW